MKDIADFIAARLDEREQAARGATEGPWGPSGHSVITNDDIEIIEASRADSDHIARHDPAWVLADVAAKRAIIELHLPRRVRSTSGLGEERIEVCRMCDHFPAQYPCATLRQLAAPDQDHPDYDPDWRPPWPS